MVRSWEHNTGVGGAPGGTGTRSSGQLGQQAHEGLAFVRRERREDRVLDIAEHRVEPLQRLGTPRVMVTTLFTGVTAPFAVLTGPALEVGDGEHSGDREALRP